MKKTLKAITIIFTLFMAIFFAGMFSETVQAKTYTISPGSSPANNWKTNKYNHDYIVIRSYMLKFEKEGGGTLVLKKGTYTISNTIFVPSNVTIKFKDGVKLVKGTKTGTSDYSASSTMFQLIRDSKHEKSNVSGKYNGEKNIHFIGEGTVTIDMKNYNVGSGMEVAIVMANNKNVSIEGITFKNIKLGHFIEMDGCKKVTISNCTFSGMKDNDYHNKEAINLDTNDAKTGGFSQSWSKKDKTPNKNITVTNCKFKNLVRAVGTHRYSQGKYHTNIKFTNNTCTKVMTPLGILNWKKATIQGNTFKNCTSNSRYNYTILVAGARNLTFTQNTFTKCKSAELVKFYQTYQTAQHEYPATVSKLTQKNLTSLQNNTVNNCSVTGFDAKDYGWIEWGPKTSETEAAEATAQ